MAVYVWTASTGNWNDGADWMTIIGGVPFHGTVPGAGDTAEIDSGDVTATSGISASAIDIVGGTLDLGAVLAYGGAFTDAAGGTLNLDGQRLVLTGSSNALDGQVNGAGSLEVTGSAVVAANSDGGRAVIGGGATVEDAGAMTQEGALELNGNGGGELLIDGGATYTITTSLAGIDGGTFVNNGTLMIGGGDALALGSNGTDMLGGAIAGPGTLVIRGASATVTTGNVTVGTISVTGGSLNLGVDLTYAGMFSVASGGALNLDGYRLTLSGAVNQLDGRIQGAGRVKVTGAAVVAANADGGRTILGGGATIEDAAAMTQEGALELNRNGVGELRIDWGATYTIATRGASIDGGVFVSHGTLTVGAGDMLTLDASGNDTLGGVINGDGTLVIAGATANLTTGNVSVGAIDVASASLNLGAYLAYGGAFSVFSGGALNLNGQRLILMGASNHLNGDIQGAGTVKVTGAATVAANSDGGRAVIGGGATIEDSGAVTQEGALELNQNGGGELLIDGRATYTITTDGASIDGGTFVNYGMLTIGGGDKLTLDKSGTDVLGGEIMGAGTLDIDGASATFFTGNVTVAAIDVMSGSLNLGAYLAYGGALTDSSGGVLNLDGHKLILNGALNRLDGGVQGPGTVKVKVAATVAVNSDGGKTVVGGAATIEDAGLMTQEGSLELNGAGGGGELRIDGGATYTITTGVARIDGGTFVNHGMLIIGFNDTLTLGSNGTDSLGGAIMGAGTLDIDGASATVATGNVMVGAIDVVSGSLNLGAYLDYAGAFTDSSRGALNLDGGRLILSGTSNQLDGTIQGAGTVKVKGGAVVAANSDGAKTVLGGGATIEDAGTMTQEGALELNGNGGGELLIDGGATYAVTTGGARIDGGAFVNHGTLIINGGDRLTLGSNGTSTLGGAITGAGTLAINGASATITTSNLTVGAIDIANGTLALDASVAATETFHLQGGGELVLGDLAIGGANRFHGSISGFDSGGSFDALGFGTGTTFGFSENAGHTAGTLTLTDGTETAAIHFLGDYAKANFHANVGTGDTLFTFQA